MESLNEAEIREIFTSLEAGGARREGASHRLMHATETVDYIVVLQGRVTLHLEGGDVELSPFDTVVQRGTSHGWTNRTDEWAALSVAMVGAMPLPRPQRGG
jgi:quercetin dioxygenase-like cupin family protein